MTYRDENEALRARVSKLEEENLELRHELEPPPPPPPASPPNSEKTPTAMPRALLTVRRIVTAVGLLGLAFGVLYVGCVSFRGLVWLGDSTFLCPINGDVTIRNKTIRVADGPAIRFEVNCHMRLVGCDIRGPRGLELSVNNVVKLERTRVEGTEMALALGTNSKVDATGSTIVGPITPLDGRVVGVTELPIESVTKDRHAVVPLEHAARAGELARLGPGATLRSIDALYVDARGLVDLAASDYKGAVTYTYEVAVHEEVVEPPPVRPGLPVPPRPEPMRRLTKIVRLDATGMRVQRAVTDAQSPSAVVAPPRCSMAQLWTAARRAGAPENAVARIAFDASGEGAWTFTVEGTELAVSIGNGSCEPQGEH